MRHICLAPPPPPPLEVPAKISSNKLKPTSRAQRHKLKKKKESHQLSKPRSERESIIHSLSHLAISLPSHARRAIMRARELIAAFLSSLPSCIYKEVQTCIVVFCILYIYIYSCRIQHDTQTHLAAQRCMRASI